jgi:hypothetical protein
MTLFMEYQHAQPINTFNEFDYRPMNEEPRQSGTRKSANRQSGTRSGRKSGQKSGRKSGTRSGRKSPPKNRTWKQYLWDHKGKALALASIIAIVAKASMVAGVGPLGLPSYIAANYGPTVAKTFMENKDYIMNKVSNMSVSGALSSVQNAASTALDYGKTLFGYGQAASTGLQGVSTLYGAVNQGLDAVNGEEVDFGKLMGAAAMANQGLNTVNYARSNITHQQANAAMQQQNELIMDCRSIKQRNPIGPYTFQEQAELDKCEAMLQQVALQQQILQKQQEEEAKNPYANLQLGQPQAAPYNPYAYGPMQQNPYAMPYGQMQRY